MVSKNPREWKSELEAMSKRLNAMAETLNADDFWSGFVSGILVTQICSLHTLAAMLNEEKE